ncbi:MAG: hypothetical protein PHT59_06440 [Candidatus Omnitrophica bacterium]|nr:hypothetical protein [Candidatus Omnitrophota bacterium]
MQHYFRMTPNPQREELLRRNTANFPDMEVVRRKPFAKLIEPTIIGLRMPDGTARTTLRQLTDVGINYNFYPNTQGMLAPQVRMELERRAKGNRPVHFLDLGPGFGKGLELAERIAPNIYAHALGLNYPEKQSYIPRGKWMRKYFESTIVKRAVTKDGKRTASDEGFYDVIQSHYGISQSANIPASFENALNSLRYGGKLFFEAKEKLSNSKLMDVLKQQGFVIEAAPVLGGERMHAIVRKNNAVADLSEFYKINWPFKVPIDMPAATKSKITP